MNVPRGGTSESQHARRMREQGYADGHGGREARYLDATYQRAWRSGRQERAREEEENRGG